jgi:hypothetical protein
MMFRVVCDTFVFVPLFGFMATPFVHSEKVPVSFWPSDLSNIVALQDVSDPTV